ncbi:MAG: MOSC domain-containing protein [Rhodovarius sp.]|nr:MOSC domain-containing protein [Rhodovarius sp.]
MRVEAIYRYPVKGLSAEALDEVALTAGACLPHDRRFALAQGDAPFDPAHPRFLPKQNFACLMANPRLALIRSVFDPHDHALSLSAPGQEPLLANPTSEAGRRAIAAWLTRFLGPEARGTPVFHEAPGHNFTDQARKGVSIVNLATLHAVEERIGRRIEPLRLRANIYISGPPPWAEREWLGQEIQLGTARLKPFKQTVRCPATMVNPATGQRDIDLPALLAAHWGHRELGIHAEVVEDGRVAVGDGVELLPG